MSYVTTGVTGALSEMAAEVRANNIEKGWRNPDGSPTRSFGEDIALLHSELSEALEAFRDHGVEDATRPVCGRMANGSLPLGAPCPDHGLPKPEGFGSELADVLIRLLDTADAFGIDLGAEYHRKMAYNRTRSFRHGGRAL